ncbi:MAG: SpoIIE family protein phosphatase [Kineosporiaceae bacterium]
MHPGDPPVTDTARAVPDVDRLVALLPDVVYEFDLAAGCTVYVSPGAERALGYPAAEIAAPGSTFLETALHPDDRESFRDHLARLSVRSDDEPAEIDYRFRAGDGTWRRFRSRDAVSRRDDGGRATHVVGVARDVTGTQRAVDEERERQARLASRILDSVLAFVAVLDVDGTLRDINSTALTAVGVTPDRTVGRPVWDGPWFDGLAGEGERLRSAVRDASLGVARRYDATIRIADGAHLTLDLQVTPLPDDDGRIGAVVASAVDLTGRRRAEAAVRDSEERLRAVFSSIDEGFCIAEIVTAPDGRPVDYRFVEVNPRFEEMTGLRDVVGRTAHDLVPGLEPHWVQRYAQVALDGTPARFEERSDAMGRWFEVFATPVPPRGRFALVFTDITARRRYHDALREREVAERVRRERAELLAEVVETLESAPGAAERLRRLVTVLVAHGARRATVRDPAAGTVLAVAGQDAAGSDGRDTRTLTAPLDLGMATTGEVAVVLDDAPDPVHHEALAAGLHDVAARAGVLVATGRVREQEHAVAVRLQRALLPERLVTHASLAVAARYQAAGDLLEVGGDWYDSWLLPDGSVGLTVGDVVGHSLESAAAMGRIRTALAALAPASTGAGDLLGRLDDFVRGPEGAPFVTTCCVLVDPATGRLRTASAGHPPPLVVTAAGESRWLMGGRSLPLGVAAGDRRPEGVDALGPGDLLVLCSDGLVERRGRPLWDGLERLRAAVVEVRDREPAAVCEAVVERLTSGSPPSDDVVVLCARRGPAGAGS